MRGPVHLTRGRHDHLGHATTSGCFKHIQRAIHIRLDKRRGGLVAVGNGNQRCEMHDQVNATGDVGHQPGITDVAQVRVNPPAQTVWR